MAIGSNKEKFCFLQGDTIDPTNSDGKKPKVWIRVEQFPEVGDKMICTCMENECTGRSKYKFKHTK